MSKTGRCKEKFDPEDVRLRRRDAAAARSRWSSAPHPSCRGRGRRLPASSPASPADRRAAPRRGSSAAAALVLRMEEKKLWETAFPFLIPPESQFVVSLK